MKPKREKEARITITTSAPLSQDEDTSALGTISTHCNFIVTGWNRGLSIKYNSFGTTSLNKPMILYRYIDSYLLQNNVYKK